MVLTVMLILSFILKVIIDKNRVGKNNKTAPASEWDPTPVPEGFDYNMWLGPAPWVPYHKDRCLYNFRFGFDLSNGWII